jgi:hypothetical protein
MVASTSLCESEMERRTMNYTRKEWSSAFLAAIGNANPDPYILGYVIAWTQFESSPPGAAYNLLNTTEPNTPGVVSDFNSVGVKNYDSFEHGIEANAKVLQNGLYSEMFKALKDNNDIALKAPDQAIIHELGIWGTGHAADIAARANNTGSLLPDQPFPGEGPTGIPSVIPSGPPAPVEPPSKVVKIGKGEDFRLILIGDRWTVVLKHSSEASLKAKGYLG